MSRRRSVLLLNGGYIWNKTEIKQFCFSFISDVTTALLSHPAIHVGSLKIVWLTTATEYIQLMWDRGHRKRQTHPTLSLSGIPSAVQADAIWVVRWKLPTGIVSGTSRHPNDVRFVSSGVARNYVYGRRPESRRRVEAPKAPSGVESGEGCPLRSRLGGLEELSPSGVRGKALAANVFSAYSRPQNASHRKKKSFSVKFSSMNYWSSVIQQ